ncbi:MAG TPA: CHAD domain-containing protein [bacterium]|jgi:CHAD domain-containing protein
MSGRVSDPSVCRFAADVLRRKLRALLKEREGVRAAEGSEHIHRMRVAARRVRAALDLFEDCFPKKQFAAWRKSVRQLTRALGAARDCDVQLAFLAGFASGLRDPLLRPGVERLRLRLTQNRSMLQAKVIRAIDRFEESDVAAAMKDALSDLAPDGKVPAAIEPEGSIRRLAAARISACLDHLLRYEPYVVDASAVAEHHAMRIAAKRFRYTMEVFEPVFGDALRSALTAAKDVQEQLGDIHDCDVWVDCIREFEAAERLRTMEYFGHLDTFSELIPGLEAVRQDRAGTRTVQHTRFEAYWKNLEAEWVWQVLRDAMEAHGQPKGRRT